MMKPIEQAEIVDGRVGIDIDGVLADFEGEFREFVCNFTGVSELPESTVWDFPLIDWGMTKEDFLSLFDEFTKVGGYARLQPINIDETRQAMHDLQSAGHELFIITQRPKCINATIDWLRKYEVPYDDLKFTTDKHKHGVEWMLDDKPDIVPSLILRGVKAYYLTQAWNNTFPWPRVSSVREYADIILNRNTNAERGRGIKCAYGCDFCTRPL